MNRQLAFVEALKRLPELDKRARCTGLVLAAYINAKTGKCYPGEDTIRSTWGIGHKRLRIDVARLVAVGVLAVEHRAGPHGANLYISRAAFVGNTAAVELALGRVLPSPSARASEASAAESGQREPQEQALTSEHHDAQRSPSGDQRSPSGVQRSPQGHDEPPNPERSEGGGGGGAVDDPTPDGVGPRLSSSVCLADVECIIDAVSTSLRNQGNKTILPRLDRRLNSAIVAKLEGGWSAEALTIFACDEPWPRAVQMPSAFLAARLEKLPGVPDEQINASIRERNSRLAEAQSDWFGAVGDLAEALVPDERRWLDATNLFRGLSAEAAALVIGTDANPNHIGAAPASVERCRTDVALVHRVVREALLVHRRAAWPSRFVPERFIDSISFRDLLSVASTIHFGVHNDVRPSDRRQDLDDEIGDILGDPDWRKWRDEP